MVYSPPNKPYHTFPKRIDYLPDQNNRKERRLNIAKIHLKQLRLVCLQYYSKNDIPFCACCGEKTYEFLCLDHINNGKGNPAKRRTGVARWHFYKWLIINNFPKKEQLQVLCHNCNLAKGFYGICPHRKSTNHEN